MAPSSDCMAANDFEGTCFGGCLSFSAMELRNVTLLKGVFRYNRRRGFVEVQANDRPDSFNFTFAWQLKTALGASFESCRFDAFLGKWPPVAQGPACWLAFGVLRKNLNGPG